MKSITIRQITQGVVVAFIENGKLKAELHYGLVEEACNMAKEFIKGDIEFK